MILSHEKFPDVPPIHYPELRKMVKTGDIALYAGQEKFSKGIHIFTGSIWTHVALIYRDDCNDIVYNAESLEGTGVHDIWLSKRLSDPSGIIILRHKDFPDHRQREFVRFITELKGSKYDKREIFNIARSLLRDKVGWSPIEHEDNDLYICSEYGLAGLESVDCHVNLDKTKHIFPSNFIDDSRIEFIGAIKRPG